MCPDEHRHNTLSASADKHITQSANRFQAGTLELMQRDLENFRLGGESLQNAQFHCSIYKECTYNLYGNDFYVKEVHWLVPFSKAGGKLHDYCPSLCLKESTLKIYT